MPIALLLTNLAWMVNLNYDVVSIIVSWCLGNESEYPKLPNRPLPNCPGTEKETKVYNSI